MKLAEKYVDRSGKNEHSTPTEIEADARGAVIAGEKNMKGALRDIDKYAKKPVFIKDNIKAEKSADIKNKRAEENLSKEEKQKITEDRKRLRRMGKEYPNDMKELYDVKSKARNTDDIDRSNRAIEIQREADKNGKDMTYKRAKREAGKESATKYTRPAKEASKHFSEENRLRQKALSNPEMREARQKAYAADIKEKKNLKNIPVGRNK